MDPRDFRLVLRQIVVIPVVLVAVLSGVLLWQIIYLNKAIQEGQHTQQTQSSARQFLRFALDMETGLRGYLLTGKREFLEPYNAAEPAIAGKLNELKSQVAGNPAYAADVRELEVDFEEWHAYAKKMIAAGPSSPMASAPAQNFAEKQMMDRIRSKREDLLNVLDIESAHRTDEIRFVTRQTMMILLLLSLCTALGVALFIRRSTNALTESYISHLELERKSVEVANEARELLMTTLRSMTEAVVTADRHGRIEFMNPSAEALTGWTLSSALARPLSSVLVLLDEQTREPISAFDNTAASFQSIPLGSAILRRADSQIVYVEQSFAPIRSGSAFAGVVIILRDVSERRRSEAALRSSERLSILGRLSATIAHEIRNPLDAVMNLIYLLRTSANIDDTGRMFASTAEEELKRIAQITHQLLAFNRESAKPVETNVSELLEGVLKLFAPKMSAAGITVKTDFAGTRPVLALPGELRQVFSNLIANAIDVLAAGGRIAVKVSSVQEHGTRDRDGVRITIADNGPGIPGDVLGSLYTPFFTTKGEKGTGLGLWVSRGIITKHEGTLQLRSATEGKRRGTVFSIFLPLRPGSRALQSPAA
jgi:PAS domain S-box-containing protein